MIQLLNLVEEVSLRLSQVNRFQNLHHFVSRSRFGDFAVDCSKIANSFYLSEGKLRSQTCGIVEDFN